MAKLVKVVYHGSRQSKATGWHRWGSFAIAHLDDNTTKYFGEGNDYENHILKALSSIGVDISGYQGWGAFKGYPPKPESELYQHNWGFEKPIKLGEWSWSTTFGRWSRDVVFADGWSGNSYPKIN